MRLFALFLAFGAAGCVQPPERPVDREERFAFRTARTPYAAAICIGRNAKGRSGVTAEERLLGASSMEVVVRSGSRSRDTLAVAQVIRDGSFSNVSILVTKVIGAEREGFARALMTDC